MTLTHGGLERSYLLYRPAAASVDSKPSALLFVLHGGGGTAAGMLRLTRGRFNELADRHGFHVVYPQGFAKAWNEGRTDLISDAHRRGVDDVGFFAALITELVAKHPIDAKRVFATGISNGGMMSLRLGCSLPGQLRGVAPVAASIPADIVALCQQPSGVSLVMINGTEDPLVPDGGGAVKVFGRERGQVIGTARSIDLWRLKNHCAAPAQEQELPSSTDDGTRVTRVEYGGCRAGSRVVLYRVQGGGHTWPGGTPYLAERLIGRTSRDLVAADALWDIFGALN